MSRRQYQTKPRQILLALALSAIMLAPVALGAPGARQVDTSEKRGGWPLVDPFEPIALNLALSDDAPETVYAGQSFATTFEIDNEGLSPELIHVVPGLHADSAACTIIGVSIEVGTGLIESTYYLAPNDDYELRESMQSWDLGDEFEPSQSIPVDYIRITIKGSTSTDETGLCLLGITVTRAVSTGIWLDSISSFAKVLVMEQPPTTVALGTLRGEGGPIRKDVIVDATSALDDVAPLDVPMTILTLSEHARVNLTGTASWDDGMDWDDYGRFFFETNGERKKSSMQTIAEDRGPMLMWHLATFPAGSAEKPINHRVCFGGEYVDGGLYEDIDDRKRRCVNLEVAQVPELESVGLDVPTIEGLLRQVFREFNLPLSSSDSWATILADRGSVLLGVPEAPNTHLYLDAKTYRTIMKDQEKKGS